MLQDNGLLTEEQVAGQFQLSVATLRNWRAQKRGPEPTKIGRRCWYRQDALQKWVASRQANFADNRTGRKR